MRANISLMVFMGIFYVGCSGSSSSTPSIPKATTPQYLYVGNGGDNSISQFVVGSNGALSPLSPATVATGAFPAKLVVDPQGRYLFAKNTNDGTMNAYTINANGTLAPNGSMSGLGGGGYTAIHPSGGYLYVTTYGPTIQQFVVNSNGTLSPNTPASVTVAGNSTGITLTPSGSYAYASAFGGNVVNQLSIDGSGKLALLNPGSVAVPDNPRQVTVTPNGSYLYVASNSGNAVSLFKIGSDGKLTPNTPATVTLANPGALAVSRNGKWLFVSLDTGIAQFVINSDGTLTANTPATFTVSFPFNIVTDMDDQYLYYTNWTNNGVGQLGIAANGTLGAIPGAPASVASGSMTWGLALVRK